MTAVEWFANQLGITSGTMLEQAKEMEKAATISKKEILEISDEEIGKGRDENIPIDEKDMWSERFYFTIGAKWYREQLRQRK